MIELDFRKDPAILSLVVDTMAVGVFTVDAKGSFVAWSEGAERITGYPRAEVIGKPCRILEGPNCKGFQTLAELLEGPELPPSGICNQECKVLSRDGRELYLHGDVRILTDEQGRVIGAVGTFVDLTSFLLAHEKIALLEEQAKSRSAFHRLVGKSAPMQEVFRRLRLAAQSEVTVLLTGESGTGKELAAGAIHSLSARKDRPFIGVNCSAIPETLLESELFGHVKGAFTGAVRDKVGIFQAAEGGTLFLDEIGDVSPLLQLKLLRVLQEREIRRVGDDRPSKTNVRLITATNKDLGSLMASGAFREDFYYRIRVFEIALPPLRERREEIPLLVEHFVTEFRQSLGKPVEGITRDALQGMMDYPWPGNVRELRNAIEHAFVTAEGDHLTLLDLPLEIRNPRVRPAKSHPEPPLSPQDRAERLRIEEALRKSQGNRTEAAKYLKISRVTLWKKIRRLGIEAGEREG
ncbi:MAG: sigma 54-interacting transcriptional regulator [Candidatus Tectomicrobia bacterium]|uniref:Sigma 54-interacting transcriptional regulator n=1 Tax=Tectimicrobiota bacterium TaxID=2528274 RepID=A0A932CM06_UNCTE|nr:sigma 54-interacting transcriptional regulator [Candidatus Tectomicrobia bacterium]